MREARPQTAAAAGQSGIDKSYPPNEMKDGVYRFGSEMDRKIG